MVAGGGNARAAQLWGNVELIVKKVTATFAKLCTFLFFVWVVVVEAQMEERGGGAK